MAANSKVILVTGDAICEHSYFTGERLTADSKKTPGFRIKRSGGGSLLLCDLIARVTTRGWQTEFGLDDDFSKLPASHHAFCLWKPHKCDAGAKDEGAPGECWRAVDPPLGYGNPGDDAPGATAAAPLAAIRGRRKPLRVAPSIVVIDDAGLGFRRRDCRRHWPLGPRWKGDRAPRWVVLKLSGSIGEGDLWHELVTQCPDNLVVIVSADQLRRRDVRIGCGLSWEATAEDLTSELHGNHALAPLLKARHLIVTFRTDGAYWLHRKKDGQFVSRLVFDAKRAEGEWAKSQGQGIMFGYMSCVTASIVHQLCANIAYPDIEQGLVAGLSACRTLLETGYVLEPQLPATKKRTAQVEEPKHPHFPFTRVANAIARPTHEFVGAHIPPPAGDRGRWMMLDEWQALARAAGRSRAHTDFASAVAALGSDVLGRLLPVAQFGALQTVDRGEIENLRTIRQLIVDYQADPAPKQPLSIGVFGPPGAGKSFGVKQIAKAVLKADDDDILTFNLSQFRDPAELNGAFHRVRDRALMRRTPLVFWDEFDSRGYFWLQYLLAPMQDGAFQDGEITHPIGKCVFVFAGATSPDFATFGPCNPGALDASEQLALGALPDERRVVESQWLEFVLKKGPDFQSRLVGYLNVLGPNQRQCLVDRSWRRQWRDDSSDRCYPIRRALFIRSQFKLEDGEPCRLDPGVLRAMLEVRHYKAGSRSLEFLCKHLKQTGGKAATRSHLPGRTLLDMHVDADEFWEICERDLHFAPISELLAEGLHESWLRNLSPQQRRKNPYAKPWNGLPQDVRNSNVAQAARIPRVLELAGLRAEPGQSPGSEHDEGVRTKMQQSTQILAEAEHNLWVIERTIQGWRYANIPEKDVAQKRHPLLIPYTQLPKDEQPKDVIPVVGKAAGKNTPREPDYVDRLKQVNYRVEHIPEPD